MKRAGVRRFRQSVENRACCDGHETIANMTRLFGVFRKRFGASAA